LIYGAARAGKILHDEITSNPELRSYSVIGFVDNAPELNGRRLCGIPVRKESDWIRQTWNCAPEIWISTKFISDEQGQAFAQRWNGPVTIRRVQLHMEMLERSQKAVTPFIRTSADHESLQVESLPMRSQPEPGSSLAGHA
jgi:FlaA1/EpsC-like NDP-sugar epimerase